MTYESNVHSTTDDKKNINLLNGIKEEESLHKGQNTRIRWST